MTVYSDVWRRSDSFWRAYGEFIKFSVIAIAASVVLTAITLAGYGFLVMKVWNWFVPLAFHSAPSLSFGKAVGLVVVIDVLVHRTIGYTDEETYHEPRQAEPPQRMVLELNVQEVDTGPRSYIPISLGDEEGLRRLDREFDEELNVRQHKQPEKTIFLLLEMGLMLLLAWVLHIIIS